MNPNMTTRSLRRAPRVPLVATALLVSLTALAGCTGLGGDDVGELDAENSNAAPDAKLTVDRDHAYNDENFEFDASQSSDPDGELTEYRFDFGDGTQETVPGDGDEVKVTHMFAKGGEYTVTLTVRDDGKDRAGELTDTDTVEVAVNERQPVAITTVAGTDGQANATETQTPGPTAEFEVYEGADKFQVDVEVQSLVLAGSSDITVRVLDADGDTVAEDTVSVEQDDSESLLLEGMLTEEGLYTIEAEAQSGAGSVEGEVRILYDLEFQPGDDDQADEGVETPG